MQTSVAFSQTPEQVTPRSITFRYLGEGSSFFLLALKNILLTLVTLGLYAPWAKTARRKYIWSHVEIDGQRLSYTGNGKELFIGYVKVFAVYAVLLLVPWVAGKVAPATQVPAQLVMALGILALIPFAMFWSRRYLLSRTLWRGVRLGLEGSAKPYARTFFVGYLLSVVTLGLYAPFMMTKMRKLMTEASRFGTGSFAYDGDAKEVFWIVIKGVLLSIVTLGIYQFWLVANLERYHLSHTTFQGARGRFDVTGGQLFGLFLLHLFGTTLTLGIAFPWILTHSLRTLLDGVRFEGQVDYALVSARNGVGAASADVLAGAMGVELGL